MASVNKIALMSGAKTAASNTGDTVSLEAKQVNFIGHFSASAVNAATTATAKIEHSPDGSIWYDLTTFAALVGVTGNELKQITGNVFPYVRASMTLAGVTKSATVDIALYCDRA